MYNKQVFKIYPVTSEQHLNDFIQELAMKQNLRVVSFSPISRYQILILFEKIA